MVDFTIPSGFKRGQKVRDKITGLEGILESFTELHNGSVHLIVQPKVTDGGTVPERIGFDHYAMEVVDEELCDLLPQAELPFKVDLGQLVEDKITGIVGTVTARSITLNGCLMVIVTPRHDAKAFKQADAGWLDHSRLIDRTPVPAPVPAIGTQERRTGAPMTRHPRPRV